MKVIQILTHPICVLVLFCLVLISGENFGGFYLLYVLMALPHGGIHAILAVAGTAVLLFSYLKYGGKSVYFIDPLLNILGVFCLYLSLWLFFLHSWDFNQATFQQSVPIGSFVLFGLVSLGFLVRSVLRFAKPKPLGPTRIFS